jgi:hypothetical protein
MFLIENGTADDAMIKVAGGPSGQHEMVWALPHRKTLRLALPYPEALLLWIEVGQIKVGQIELRQREIAFAAIKALRLRKTSTGYHVEVIKDVGKKGKVAVVDLLPGATSEGSELSLRTPATADAASEPGEIKGVAGERSDLLARKHSGKRLSPSEQEKLESLTTRLKALLPPVSSGELEVLLGMAEDAERIRKRARERRQRLDSD